MRTLNFNPFGFPERSPKAASTPARERRMTVRFSADDTEHVLDEIDDSSFRVIGRAMPAGVWLTAVLQHSPAFDVRIPVVARDQDVTDRQRFEAVTDAGRELLRALAVQSAVPPVDTHALPPARVLPRSVPVLPFVVRQLS
jgi:hypothetical protein